ncbi:MAG: hypothetical protein HY606_05675 [Planctomycetes bacterium]|nr:hypothetical protein [Planctomycetota bacterium]
MEPLVEKAADPFVKQRISLGAEKYLYVGRTAHGLSRICRGITDKPTPLNSRDENLPRGYKRNTILVRGVIPLRLR